MGKEPPVNVSIATKVIVAASPSDVFKYLTNLKYHFFWNPHLISINPIKSLKMGTAYESESLILGVTIKGTNVVSKFDEDKEFELENQLGAISYRINFRLSRHNR